MLNVIFENTGNFIWTYYFLPVLFVAAFILTIGCRAIQFRRFGFAMKQTLGKAFVKTSRGNSGLSPFQAASTALGSTVGTGNIVGTAQAITMGGPGALFWLWLSALISMIVKYAEILLAVHFKKGTMGYGPMDYIEKGLGSKKIASFYAVLALLSSLAMGNITQASSITDAFILACNNSAPGPALNGNAARLAVGLSLCAISILILSGGAKRIGSCAQALVPFMVLLFIAVSGLVIISNAQHLPDVLKTVIKEAFAPGSVCGGIAGASTAQCIQWGVRRSVFSNEAGLGTSAIAHSSANTDDAVKQAFWGIFEVFADTIVICSCTSFCILCSGIEIPWGKLCGSELFTEALSTVLGPKISAIMLAVFIGLFAYTSIIGWALYGTKCSTYLFGEKSDRAYHIVFCALLIAGSVMPLEQVWQISDTINALMSIPNLMAVLILSPLVCRVTRSSLCLTKEC